MKKKLVNTELSDDSISFMQNMYVHSGNHYRHLENQRNNYVKFFYATLFGVLGLIEFLLKNDKTNFMDLDLIELLFFVLILFGSLILGAIKKISFALTMHENILVWVAEKILKKDNIKIKKILYKDSEHLKKMIKHPLLNVQFVMEVSIFTVLLILDISYLLRLIENIRSDMGIIRIVMALLIITMFLYQLLVLLKRNKKSK